MRKEFFGVVAVLATVTTPAFARDRTGYTQIAARDFSAAERTLVAERRIFPNRPELMLNLASVYRQTGRTSEAEALYRAVATAPDVAMDLPGGAIASSHDLAQAGLARTAAPQLTAR